MHLANGASMVCYTGFMPATQQGLSVRPETNSQLAGTINALKKNCYGRAGKVCGDRSTGRTTSGLLHVDLSSLIRTATHPFPD